MENLNEERVLAGLPASVSTPDHIIIAFEDGVISERDIVPNVAAHISATYKSNVEPPLSTSEVVARWKHIKYLANLSQAQ